MKLNLQLTIAILSIAVITACTEAGHVDKSEANTNLLTGLVIGQQQGKSSVMDSLAEIRGYWKGGFCSAGTCSSFTSNVSIVQDPSGFGIWASGSSYLRIISVDIVGRTFIYQYLPNDTYSPSKYTKVIWTAPTTTGCENSASKCFYYCTVYPNFATLTEAENVNLSNYSSADPTRTGCGGFGWSKALFVSLNPTNW
ncbi:hypothetical protein ND861_18200 [Leptospira sp. 2 VSF19]|uniref:Lipoprotein n=1 Tax=Leptospira soteropolitanensis TaxID=2950025 RepID=A0AAW5VP79_9LEPT|nr:hypothetical protein [Leptospira soteropolitanensis]MCW7494547.1 hypothetical protein [Leptospira soteropolitanensis]MCW7502141.1 hypothetical protein [Leptospira soteropolitanensis]MCW7524429.1 hypothetical protein [Leptospira soteropolitanensis]MCW7528295.1 hypothetical protein [Leptospira soteropolitanensis]MCW7532111.1 hypothetical protein [Leptospira soteropolitanensis]